MTQDILIQEIQLLPESLKQEVLDFLLFIKSKHGLHLKEMVLNEPAAPTYGKPSASVEKPKPGFGTGKYKVTLAPDFNEPMELVASNSKVAEPATEKPKPYFGCGSVKGWLAPDFDEPLEDFKEYME